MTTLGERLAAQDAERVRLGRLAAEERARRTQEEFQANEAEVRAVFEKAKTEIMAAVEANRTPAPVQAIDWRPFIFDNKTPADLKHPYHHVYREFLPWAESEGLELRMTHDHDGGGVRSWWNVVFRPAKAA